MRIQEIDMLIRRGAGSEPITQTRKLVAEFERTCAKINREKALQQAEEQLQHDQILCEVSKLTSLAVSCRVSSEVKKALLIARTALELAAEELTDDRHPVPIRRVP